ncbi:hypothetical protein AQ836_00795 [Burkholderia pseudomallei]|nr:hypothetical protein AQ836_00795 [Burkholderia pseudomallei]
MYAGAGVNGRRRVVDSGPARLLRARRAAADVCRPSGAARNAREPRHRAGGRRPRVRLGATPALTRRRAPRRARYARVSSTSTAGSFLPSRNSRNAPPPVEM